MVLPRCNNLFDLIIPGSPDGLTFHIVKSGHVERMERAVVFREGHSSLSGKIMSTIFQSIKPLHLAQLAAHTEVKERDLCLHERASNGAHKQRERERGGRQMT